MEPQLKLSKRSEALEVDAIEYKSIVGSLRYIGVGIVSRYMEAPKSEHLTAIKDVLQYIKGAVGCVYSRDERAKVKMHGYIDSGMAGDVDDRRSTSGVIYLPGDNVAS
jgi:hypothetical protein